MKCLVTVLCLSFFSAQASAAGGPRWLWERVRGVFSSEQRPEPPETPLAEARASVELEARRTQDPNDDDIEFRQSGQLVERRLNSIAGVYIEFDRFKNEIGARALALKTETHEDSKVYYVIDAWEDGDVTRLFSYPLAEIRPFLHRTLVNFILYVTEFGLHRDRAVFGKTHAPYSLFLMKYGEAEDSGEGKIDSMSIHVREYGRMLYTLGLLRAYKSDQFTEWRRFSEQGEGVSLGQFVAGEYAEPPMLSECEKHLSRTSSDDTFQ